LSEKQLSPGARHVVLVQLMNVPRVELSARLHPLEPQGLPGGQQLAMPGPVLDGQVV
jgi:hypothetical protein